MTSHWNFSENQTIRERLRWLAEQDKEKDKYLTKILADHFYKWDCWTKANPPLPPMKADYFEGEEMLVLHQNSALDYQQKNAFNQWSQGIVEIVTASLQSSAELLLDDMLNVLNKSEWQTDILHLLKIKMRSYLEEEDCLSLVAQWQRNDLDNNTPAPSVRTSSPRI